MDAVQPLDPAGRLVQIDPLLRRLLFADLQLRRNAVGVVGLVVDDDDVARGRQFPQNPTGKGLVALGTLLHHRALRLLEGHQRMPVLDEDFRLVQLLAQCLGGTEPEDVIEVVRLPRVEDPQPFLHRNPRRHNEHGP